MKILRHWKAVNFVLAGFALLLLASPPVQAEEELGEIMVIGSRAPQRSTLDSMRPVDILTAQDLERAGGETESGKILRTLLPSFNQPDSTISDGTDSVRPGALRGLGPDQTLVLINGKRRHSSSLVHVNGSYGRGTSGVDFAAIPSIAIGAVEVLRDGAAAQYGSDAIAGVINIRLADLPAGSGKGFFQIGKTYEGDGEQTRFGAAAGFYMPGTKATLTGEFSTREPTDRGGLDGTCQYSSACDDVREASFNRRSFRIGDADAENMAVTFNMAQSRGGYVPYLFILASQRDSESGGFYRTASSGGNNAEIYPNGFLPLINTEIMDASFVSGVKGRVLGYNADFSVSYAANSFDFSVENSVNASYAGDDLATSADSGGFDLTQSNIGFDFSREISLFGLPGVIAFGPEWRTEQYEINAGEPYSYLLCADDPAITDATTECTADAAAGIQVFPGFKPSNEVDESRAVTAFYIDSEMDLSSRLQAGLAVRYEDYEDAGNNFAVHGRARYDYSPEFALRGSAGTGFRAPSLQQTWFNNISTQFRTNKRMEVERLEVGTLNAGHALTRALNIPELAPEDSLHLAAGMVLRLTEGFSLTLDAYQIEVEDRIVLSGQISKDDIDDDAELAALYDTNNITDAQFFINLAETRTRGADLAVQWEMPPLYDFERRLTFTASYAETKIEGGISAPGRLAEIPGLADTLFSSSDRAYLEDFVPRLRAVLTHDWESPKWRARAGGRYYGSYRVTEGGLSQRFQPEWLVDAEIARKLGPNISIALGGRNLFDITPDRTLVSRARSCDADDVGSSCYVESPGVFLYNRRSAPFGFNGAFYYLRLTAEY